MHRASAIPAGLFMQPFGPLISSYMRITCDVPVRDPGNPILDLMRRMLIVVSFVLIFTGTTLAQPLAARSKQAGSAEDEAAIQTIVNHWQQNWDKFDASVLEGDYAEDADWLNAFGVKYKGSANIIAFVATVVKRPQNQGRHTTWSKPEIRFLRPDVAIAYRDYQTGGNKTPDGKDAPERRTHSTWVMAKDEGRWRIISQVISDDNGR